MAFFIGVILGLIIVLIISRKFFSTKPIRSVPGGYKDDVIVPHTEPIELYFADMSSMSMKTRMCLSAAGISFKPHLKSLPSSGSFETKRPDYLRINPAGTVPVLVHHGHPIHETSEQMKYIATKLVPADGRQLMPTDPEKKAENEYWIDKTSMHTPELAESVAGGLNRRAGNCLPIITMPVFAIKAKTFSWKTVFTGFLVGGFGHREILTLVFSVLGARTFKYLPGLSNTVKLAKRELSAHLSELEEFLRRKGTKYIGGGDITLADIGWAPILECMRFAGWWEHVDETKYAYVIRYWKDMRELPCYIEATRLVEMDSKVAEDVRTEIRQLKDRYVWFKTLYE